MTSAASGTPAIEKACFYRLPTGELVRTRGLMEGSECDWECKYQDVAEPQQVTLSARFLSLYGKRE